MPARGLSADGGSLTPRASWSGRYADAEARGGDRTAGSDLVYHVPPPVRVSPSGDGSMSTTPVPSPGRRSLGHLGETESGSFASGSGGVAGYGAGGLGLGSGVSGGLLSGSGLGMGSGVGMPSLPVGSGTYGSYASGAPSLGAGHHGSAAAFPAAFPAAAGSGLGSHAGSMGSLLPPGAGATPAGTPHGVPGLGPGASPVGPVSSPPYGGHPFLGIKTRDSRAPPNPPSSLATTPRKLAAAAAGALTPRSLSALSGVVNGVVNGMVNGVVGTVDSVVTAVQEDEAEAAGGGGGGAHGGGFHVGGGGGGSPPPSAASTGYASGVSHAPPSRPRSPLPPVARRATPRAGGGGEGVSPFSGRDRERGEGGVERGSSGPGVGGDADGSPKGAVGGAGSGVAGGGSVRVLGGGAGPGAWVPRGRRAGTSALAGALYCLSSMSMILLNKAALSSFRFRCPTLLLAFQCCVAVLGVRLLGWLGVAPRAPWEPRVARAWLPVSLIFVLMLGTSFWALEALNVAMATLLKNLTNLFTALGERALRGTRHGPRVWATMGLMALSAAVGGWTDLNFSARGYLWQLANCAAAAAYSLTLRSAIDAAARARDDKKPDELCLVLHNNVLSIPWLLLLATLRGELAALPKQPDLLNPAFVAVATLSGVLGFAISFTSIWFISTTSATVYSLVGSLNKVPIAFLGILLFRAPLTRLNAASIVVGLAAGAVLVLAKQKKKAPKTKDSEED